MFCRTLVILLLTITLRATDGFVTTICDCSHPASNGFVEFNYEDCNLPNKDKPSPIHYTVLSTLPVIQRFKGHTCSMWKMSKSVYRDFLQWDSVKENRIPLEVSAVPYHEDPYHGICHDRSLRFYLQYAQLQFMLGEKGVIRSTVLCETVSLKILKLV